MLLEMIIVENESSKNVSALMDKNKDKRKGLRVANIKEKMKENRLR